MEYLKIEEIRWILEHFLLILIGPRLVTAVDRVKTTHISERSCAITIDIIDRAFIVSGYLLGISYASYDLPWHHAYGSVQELGWWYLYISSSHWGNDHHARGGTPHSLSSYLGREGIFLGGLVILREEEGHKYCLGGPVHDEWVRVWIELPMLLYSWALIFRCYNDAHNGSSSQSRWTSDKFRCRIGTFDTRDVWAEEILCLGLLLLRTLVLWYWLVCVSRDQQYGAFYTSISVVPWAYHMH